MTMMRIVVVRWEDKAMAGTMKGEEEDMPVTAAMVHKTAIMMALLMKVKTTTGTTMLVLVLVLVLLMMMMTMAALPTHLVQSRTMHTWMRRCLRQRLRAAQREPASLLAAAAAAVVVVRMIVMMMTGGRQVAEEELGSAWPCPHRM